MKTRRAARRFNLLEAIEPRQLLSALGFGSAIHPPKRHGASHTPALQMPTIVPDPSWSQISAEPPAHFSPIDAFTDLALSHVVLNNLGYNAVDDARDSVAWSGTLGVLHVPLPFAMATMPQTIVSRTVLGQSENLYLAIDWGDGTPQTLGTFQSISPAAYLIGGTHTWTAPGDYRVTAFLIVNGPGSDLPFVLSAAAGVAHVAATPQSTQPAIVLHLPLYDPQNYVAPAFPQIKLPTSTPVDESGHSRVYDFVVA